MPFPASQEAMRKHYEKNWHRDAPPPDENGKRSFRVRFNWEISGDFDEVIEAEDEDEAEQIARERVLGDYHRDIEIDFLKITDADPKEIEATEKYRAAIAKARGEA